MVDSEVFNPTVNVKGPVNNEITANVDMTAENSSPRPVAPTSTCAAHANAAGAKALHACAAVAVAGHGDVPAASAPHADATVAVAVHADASVGSGAHSDIAH